MTLRIINARPFLANGPGLRPDGTAPALHDVLIDGDRIAALSPSSTPPPAGPATGVGTGSPARVIDARGGVLLPGFVDCHTHACWADQTGDHRLDEWDQKRAGTPYLEILARGGGIMSSVRAVRAAKQEALTTQLLARLSVMLRHGTTTVEVKCGYGLSEQDELKMLRAIAAARPHFAGTIVATALLGHAIDPDQPRERFVEETITRTLPAVSSEFGTALAVDAFCEQGAWTLEECTRLFEAAAKLGHPVRVHADQFTSMGMVRRAIALGAVSADHLEASDPQDLAALGASRTFGVGLPACGLHVDGRFADLSLLPRPVIATNLNPGSAPCYSMGLVAALAVRRCGLSPVSALLAATTHPAALLGLSDRGVIEPGRRADLVLTRHLDARQVSFSLGDNPAEVVICGGRVV